MNVGFFFLTKTQTLLFEALGSKNFEVSTTKLQHTHIFASNVFFFFQKKHFSARIAQLSIDYQFKNFVHDFYCQFQN